LSSKRPLGAELARGLVRRAQALETGAQADAPVREMRRSRLLAAKYGVRRPRRFRSPLGARDPVHAAVEPSLLEDRLGELGPGAVTVRGDVVNAVRQLEQRAHRRREMADVRGRRALVVYDRQPV